MLEVYSDSQSVVTGNNIIFSNLSLKTNNDVSITNAGTVLNINRSGIYEISFSGYATTTGSGSVGVQLYADGVAVPNASSQATTGSSESGVMAFNKLLRVSPAPIGDVATISVQYTGANGILNIGSLIVKKVA